MENKINNNIIKYSEELEGYIINQLLYFNNYLVDTIPKIKKEYFYFSHNRDLFDTIVYLFYENKPTTPEFVLEYCKLKNDILFEKLFSILYNSDNSKSLDLLSEQIKQLETFYFKRIVDYKFSDMIKRVREYDEVSKIIRDLQYTTNDILNKTNSKENNNIENLVDLFELETTKISTGFSSIDNFCPVNKTDLVIIGARPSIGKSAFALNIAINIAKEKDVLFISMEMSQKEIVDRIFCIVANEIRYKILSEKSIMEFTKEKVKQLKMIIMDKSMSIEEIQQYIMKYSDKLGAVFIDYIQLVNVTKGGVNRYQDITEISRKLKLMTMDFEIPIFALSQLNRNVEMRNDKKPMLADLRESGSIEQDGNQVWLIHREGFYNPEANQSQMDLIVAKNRSGATGEVPMGFVGQKYKIYNSPFKYNNERKL